MPLDFDAAVCAPFRMQPGLRKLAPGARQLSALDPHAKAFVEKLAVLSSAADEALLSTAGFDAVPALRVLAHEAALQCPGAFVVDEAAVVSTALGLRLDWQGATLATLTGAHAAAAACVQALPPEQRLAALLCLALHEDFAIVDGRQARLPWLAVCLPSHWSPRDKIGRAFAEVHGPVADNAILLAASEHLARLVCQPQRWERFVWTLSTQATLDQHPARHTRPPWAQTAEAVGEQAMWRTEHQTFIPLPALQQALFTIHVEVQPLADAIATPQRAQALHAALASMSEAVLAYRGLHAARDPLLAWLAARAGP